MDFCNKTKAKDMGLIMHLLPLAGKVCEDSSQIFKIRENETKNSSSWVLI